MSRPLGEEKKRKVVELKEAGKTYQEIMDETGVANSTISFILKRHYEKHGKSTVESKVHSSKRPVFAVVGEVSEVSEVLRTIFS